MGNTGILIVGVRLLSIQKLEKKPQIVSKVVVYEFHQIQLKLMFTLNFFSIDLSPKIYFIRNKNICFQLFLYVDWSYALMIAVNDHGKSSE